MSLNLKAGLFFCKATGMLMLMAVLLVWGGTAMGEDALPAEVASGVEADAKSAPCKELKPYNNLDELLYQFYVNRGNDCFEYMSAAELEKIWDVKILSEERAKPAVYYPLSEVEFYNKPYRSERDAFYIEMAAGRGGLRKNSFYVRITKEYFERHGTLFLYDSVLLTDVRSKILRIYLPRKSQKLETSEGRTPALKITDPKVIELEIY
ncbi:hypothetical protein LJB99_07070 [Deltaproteobacteria bacterium OttesenSCG-928-K17]|nr:hypothetical protein [Deltaproteobacteria bacterium OttesenSCG-928-K17]